METAARELRFPCGQCGAGLVYQPGSTHLVCPYCSADNPIPESPDDVREVDYEAELRRLASQQETIEHKTLTCSACAAEIERPPNVTAMACPFCGSDLVATEKTARLVKPGAVLPFAIDGAAALEKFRGWLKSLWFAPTKVKRFAREEARLSGVYVPYWTYDAETTSRYTGQRGEHYYVTVGTGKNRRTQRRTRWYPASGTVQVPFDDVLVLASRSLPKAYADRLEPWDLEALVPYADEYLSGFRGESYQIDLAEGFLVAQTIMSDQIRTAIKRDIGGDEQRIDSVKTQYSRVTFKHILLPVWISAYKFRDRTYRFLVNARTGEVQGARPYSWIKITAAVLAGLAAVAVAIWAFNR